jgi:hypothetical protein
MIRAIQPNGTVVCVTDAPLNRPVAPGDNYIAAIDNSSLAPYSSSITIGTDGLPLMSYYDINNDLKVAHCEDPLCANVTRTTIDSTGDVGKYSSLVIGADGLGLISYYDATNGDLKAAHCTNVACTNATLKTLDNIGNTGLFTSVIIGADALGVISYYDATNGELRVTHCADLACTGGTFRTVDGISSDAGKYSAITLGADGLALIAYADFTTFQVKIAHCNDFICETSTRTVLDQLVIDAISIVTGRDGLALVTYGAGIAHCRNIDCTSWSVANLLVLPSSVTIGADGLGLITFWEPSGPNRSQSAAASRPACTVGVAHCTDQSCSSASYIAFEQSCLVTAPAVTIGSDGLGLIVYQNGDGLQAVHCANSFCLPYFRQR